MKRHVMHRATLAAIAALVLASAARADRFTVEVPAGDTERVHTPVRFSLHVSAEHAERTAVVLAAADGTELLGQLTGPGLLVEPAEAPAGFVARELHCVIPRLAAGESLTVDLDFAAPVPEAPSFAWEDTPQDNALLSFDDRPVLRYMYAPLDTSSPQVREETYKVFHHLYNPAGTRPLTKGPGGLFSHHRGLFYGFNRITDAQGRSADTWHCSGDAHQSHQEFLAEEAGPVLGRHTVVVGWHGHGGEMFAREQRQMTVYHTSGGQLVEFASRLESLGGTIRLDGDPQHAGFQFRAAQEVADGDPDANTYFLRPDGRGAPGRTRNWSEPGDAFADLPWNAMSFVVDGDRYTVVYLDHPDNPKEARYSERTYGRFGSYFEYDLTEKEPLELNYRVWLQAGEMTVDEAARRHHDFVSPPGA